MDKLSAILPPPTDFSERNGPLVGITTTVPVEVMLAGGCVPLDLNNLFICSSNPEQLLKDAERSGFPRTCCSWTKGIYGAVRRYGIKKIVVVVQGDCSNTHALAEKLEYEGVQCLPFAFPYRRKKREMRKALDDFSRCFGVDLDAADAWRMKLNQVRRAALEIDERTWRHGTVNGFENHLWLVSTSDFCSDPVRYRREAESFLKIVRGRRAEPLRIRLALVGVPPIVPELYEFIETKGARVVFNETQRQFTMPAGGDTLESQYTSYTYPYGIRCRLADIQKEINRRRVDGIIHYVQSFCFRRIEDGMLRESVDVPVITVEQDRPGGLSGQVKTRLEAFVEILEAGKAGRSIFGR